MSKLKWECKYLSYNFTIPFYTLSTAHYRAWKRLYICCHYEYEKMSGNRQWCGKVFLVLEQFFLFSKHNTLKSFYIIFLLKKMNILNIFEDEKEACILLLVNIFLLAILVGILSCTNPVYMMMTKKDLYYLLFQDSKYQNIVKWKTIWKCYYNKQAKS